ncbi:MAG TPA: 4-hydroxy-tetrahydrodipicolinate reductase [Caulobacteraceae bacterium]|jgi:4-hydroxy-tetrahydrodipicolinate reductase
MTEAVRIGVAGALGRMGRAIEALAANREDIQLCARLDRPGASDAAAHAIALSDFDTAAKACNVIVDFSTATASAALAASAAARGGPALVIGATGFSPSEDAQVREAAQRVAIVRAGNFSLGVNLLAALVEEAARRLPAADWDIEILETHHRRKIDAPSGTALLLGEAAARGRGEALDPHALAARSGITGERPRGGVGFASLRGGGVIGEHAVLIAGEEETITLSHSARDRTLFARGALIAALWVHGKPPGLYGMREVLGL